MNDPRACGGRLLTFSTTEDARIGCALVVHAVVPHVVGDLFAAAEAGQAGGCGEGVCGGGSGDLSETEGGAGLAPFAGVDGAGGAGVGVRALAGVEGAFLGAGLAAGAELVD